MNSFDPGRLLALSFIIFSYGIQGRPQTLPDCCVITTPEHFSSTIRRNDGNLVIRNNRDTFPNFFGGNVYANSANVGGFGIENGENFGSIGSQPFGQSPVVNPFQVQSQIPQQQSIESLNGFDANTWAQNNLNLFQQSNQNNFESYGNTGAGYGNTGAGFGNAGTGYSNTGAGFGNTATSYGNTAAGYSNTATSYGNAASSYGNTATSYGNAAPTYGNAAPTYGNTAPNYGNAAPSYGNAAPSYGNTATEFNTQSVQAQAFGQTTYGQSPQPQTFSSQIANTNYGLPQQPVQTYYPFGSVVNQVPQTYQPQPQPQIDSFNGQQPYIAPEPTQQNNYGSYPQPGYQTVAPEPETTPQPAVDMSQLQQYAQYLEMIQKQYGIKLPPPPVNAPQSQITAEQTQNPYAAGVQPQTQSHIQGTLNPQVQGTYTVQAGSGQSNYNQLQTGYNGNYNLQLQGPSKPVVSIQPQESIYQVPQQPPAAPQPYYPEYSGSNTVVEQPQPVAQPQPAPHIVIPEPKPQPQVYIPPTQATAPPTPLVTRPPPIMITESYEREVTTKPTPPRPASTTSIQALTQQIRKLPAVLYVDSRSPDTKRTETLLRETYGLPLVAFYVDKIDKPKTVERHLQQLTAHKGMPYLFICGTFIGSQQHIDNYHANKQIPQLVEYVCGDEKKRKSQKKKTTSVAS